MIFANNRGKPISLAQLKKIKLIRPENAGKSWQGIAHHELVEDIRKNLLAITGMSYTPTMFVSPTQTEMVASFQCSQEGVFRIGVSSSHVQKRPLKFYVGTEEGWGGFVAGDRVIGGRHGLLEQNHSTIQEEIHLACLWAMDYWKEGFVRLKVSDLQGFALASYEPEQILTEAAKKKIIPWSYIGRILTDFWAKEHREAWTLYGCFAYSIALCSPMNQMEQLSKFRKLLMTPITEKAT